VNADRSSQRLTLALRDALPISMISLCARFISRKLYGAAAAMFVLSILAGCGGNPSQAPEEYGFGQLGAPAPYLIGPGDSLEIFVWDHDDLTTTVRVRPDGRISTPLVEDLQAAGKAPTELARDIENVLSNYVRAPVVTVIVENFVGESAQQVRVVGQAVEPRALQYRQGMTVLDVVIEVG